MFRLETFRLIGKSFRRFMSLTLIVFIGVSFMMGLSNSSGTMIRNADAYFDEYELADLMIYSPYGFCNEDYAKLSEASGVSSIFASREIDCHGITSRGRNGTYRVSELSRRNNRVKLVDGRMPEGPGECIYLYNNLSQVVDLGEVITLDMGSGDISEYLSQDTYTIVGFFEAPQYFSKLLGPSNYNNQELDCVILVPNSDLIFEYYTTMYVTLEGSDAYQSCTDEYAEYIEEQRTALEGVVFTQQSYLRDQLIGKAEETLAEKEQLVEEMRTVAQKQLDDAKNQLDDARVQIASYEAQLTTLNSMINALESAIGRDAAIFNGIYEGTVLAESTINDVLAIFGADGISYGSSAMEYIYNEYRNTINQFNSMSWQLNSAKAEYEAGLKEYTQAVVEFETRMADAEEQLRQARAQLSNLPRSEWIILNRDQMYSIAMFKGSCQQMGSIGTYMPLMFFLVAALVCLTTMKRLVDEQRGQIGIYAALGYSAAAITGKYVSYALMAALCGGITGVAFGGYLFPTVVYNTWKMMYYLQDVKLDYPLFNILISILSFSVLMCAITAKVVLNIVKDVPASLMRPLAPKKGKEIFLEKIPALWNSMSFTSKITARNIFRYKSRFLMTIAGIAGCTGLLVLGFGIKDSVNEVLDYQYGSIFKYDCMVSLESSGYMEEALETLKGDLSVDYATELMQYTTRAYLKGDEKTANLIVIDPIDSYTILDLKETDGATPVKLKNSGVIVSRLFAENNGISVGDTITIESKSRIKGDVKVAGICEMYFQHYIFISRALYESVFEESGEGTSIALIVEDKDRVHEIARGLDGYSSITDISSFLTAFNKMIQALNLIILVIILVAGSLAFVVLVNLTQVNISERVREIATLKVLGFNNREVNSYIFKEIFLLSLIGCVVGIPIGIIEHRFIINVIRMEMIMFGNIIYLPSYLYSVGITILFTLIVLTFMRKPLRDVDMVESLKSVE